MKNVKHVFSIQRITVPRPVSTPCPCPCSEFAADSIPSPLLLCRCQCPVQVSHLFHTQTEKNLFFAQSRDTREIFELLSAICAKTSRKAFELGRPRWSRTFPGWNPSSPGLATSMRLNLKSYKMLGASHLCFFLIFLSSFRPCQPIQPPAWNVLHAAPLRFRARESNLKEEMQVLQNERRAGP